MSGHLRLAWTFATLFFKWFGKIITLLNAFFLLFFYFTLHFCFGEWNIGNFLGRCQVSMQNAIYRSDQKFLELLDVPLYTVMCAVVSSYQLNKYTVHHESNTLYCPFSLVIILFITLEQYCPVRRRDVISKSLTYFQCQPVFPIRFSVMSVMFTLAHDMFGWKYVWLYICTYLCIAFNFHVIF